MGLVLIPAGSGGLVRADGCVAKEADEAEFPARDASARLTGRLRVRGGVREGRNHPSFPSGIWNKGYIAGDLDWLKANCHEARNGHSRFSQFTAS